MTSVSSSINAMSFGYMELGSKSTFDPQKFYAFINETKPFYKGTNSRGEEVTVKLSDWNTYSHCRFGSGEIHPNRIPSMYRDSSPHEGCFDFYEDKRVIAFTSDDYAQSVVLALQVSDDFKKLSILDWNSLDHPKKVLGELTLA